MGAVSSPGSGADVQTAHVPAALPQADAPMPFKLARAQTAPRPAPPVEAAMSAPPKLSPLPTPPASPVPAKPTNCQHAAPQPFNTEAAVASPSQNMVIARASALPRPGQSHVCIILH